MQSVVLGFAPLLIRKVERSWSGAVWYPDIIDTQSHTCPHLSNGPVGTPAAYDQQASKRVESLVVVVRERLLLRGILVKPRLPLFLMVSYLKEMNTQHIHVWC